MIYLYVMILNKRHQKWYAKREYLGQPENVGQHRALGDYDSEEEPSPQYTWVPYKQYLR